MATVSQKWEQLSQIQQAGSRCMPLWASLFRGPLLLLGTQTPLGLCSHLAYPQELLCHHSRKGQRTILLSLFHHSARSLHLLQTQMPRSLLGLRPRASWGPGSVPPNK